MVFALRFALDVACIYKTLLAEYIPRSNIRVLGSLDAWPSQFSASSTHFESRNHLTICFNRAVQMVLTPSGKRCLS
jgi:hypothetical protein